MDESEVRKIVAVLSKNIFDDVKKDINGIYELIRKLDHSSVALETHYEGLRNEFEKSNEKRDGQLKECKEDCVQRMDDKNAASMSLNRIWVLTGFVILLVAIVSSMVFSFYTRATDHMEMQKEIHEMKKR